MERVCCPVCTFQIRTVPSDPPDVRMASSWDENATQFTFPSCPVRVFDSVRVATSRTRMFLSLNVAASFEPSLEKARDKTACVSGKLPSDCPVSMLQKMTL